MSMWYDAQFAKSFNVDRTKMPRTWFLAAADAGQNNVWWCLHNWHTDIDDINSPNTWAAVL